MPDYPESPTIFPSASSDPIDSDTSELGNVDPGFIDPATWVLGILYSRDVSCPYSYEGAVHVATTLYSNIVLMRMSVL